MERLPLAQAFQDFLPHQLLLCSLKLKSSAQCCNVRSSAFCLSKLSSLNLRSQPALFDLDITLSARDKQL